MGLQNHWTMDNRNLPAATLVLFSLLAHVTIAQPPPVRGDLGDAEHKRYSWHPDRLIAILGDERGRKWDLAGRGLDVRPDGKQLAAGGWSGSIYIWNAETMELERMLSGHERGVHALRYSPNGTSLTSVGADKTIRVWDIAADDSVQGTIAATLEEPPHYATFSADGGTLVFGGQGTPATRIWRSGSHGTWHQAGSIPTPKRVFDDTPADIEQLVQALDVKGMVTMSAATHAVSADGGLLASSLDGGIISIQSEDGGISATQSSTIVVWRIGGREPEKLWTIEGVGYVGAMAFSRDGGLLAVGTQDKTVRTFTIGREPPQVRHEMTMQGAIQGLCFSSTGESLAVAADTVRLWNLFTDAATVGRTAPVSQRPLVSTEMHFSPNGRTLHYVDGAVVRRWQVAAPYAERNEPAATIFEAVHSLSFTPEGTRLLTAIEQGGAHKIACWSFYQPYMAPIWEVGLEERRGDDLAVSPDGHRFVFSAYKHPQYTLELWERTDDGPKKLDVADLNTGHPGSFWCTAFSPDGTTLASGHRDGAIRMWDTSGIRLKLLKTFANVHQGGVGGLDYSPDGNALAAVDWGGEVHVWKAAGDGLLKVPFASRHGSRAYTVRFSPDGRLLATGDNGGEILLWNVDAEQPQAAKLAAHSAHVTSLDFASDGRRLLSAGQDGRVIVWDVAEKKPLAQWRFPGYVHDARFDPTGQYIATANGNGTIYVWRL